MLLINLLLSAKGTLLLRLDSRSGSILALAFCITDAMPKIFRLVPNVVLMTLNSSPSSGFALAKVVLYTCLRLHSSYFLFLSSILSLFLSYSTQLQARHSLAITATATSAAPSKTTHTLLPTATRTYTMSSTLGIGVPVPKMLR